MVVPHRAGSRGREPRESKWEEYGVRIGGPAPAGLASWDVNVQSSRVFLGAPRPAPPRDARVFGPPEHERDWCLPAEDPVVFHTFDGWKIWDSPTAAVESAPDDWILLEGELIADREEGHVRLCGLAGCADSAIAANVEMPPPDMDPQFGPLGGADSSPTCATARSSTSRASCSWGTPLPRAACLDPASPRP